MIHYHGTPITPETAAITALSGGHAFVSFAAQQTLDAAVAVCQSFAIDNGAFAAWKKGEPTTDWAPFYEWAFRCKRIPSCDFAIIPDVIDGTEAENDALVADCPLPAWFAAPVWHMHESLERLDRLAARFPRVCLGSSGEFATIGTTEWWQRIGKAMRAVCDDDGQPMVRLHGLRMLNPEVFSRIPFASADSTNIARNIGIDSSWRGNYMPATKEARAQVMRGRIESVNAPARWGFIVPDAEQASLL